MKQVKHEELQYALSNIDYSGLKPDEYRLLSALISFMSDKSGIATITENKLQVRTGLTISAINRIKKTLRSNEWIDYKTEELSENQYSVNSDKISNLSNKSIVESSVTKFRLFQARRKIAGSSKFTTWEMAVLDNGNAYFRKSDSNSHKCGWIPCSYNIVKEHSICKVKYNGTWLIENLGIIPAYRFPLENRLDK